MKTRYYVLHAEYVKANSHIEEKTVDLDDADRSRNGSLSSGDGQQPMEVRHPPQSYVYFTLTQQH
jgi:hypothetical protein